MKFLKDAILTFLFIGFLNFSDLPEASPRVSNSRQYEPDFERKKDTAYLVNFWATWETRQAGQSSGGKIRDNNKFRVMLVSREMDRPVNSRILPLISTDKIKPAAVLPEGSDRSKWIRLMDPGWSGEVPFTEVQGHDRRITWSNTFFDALISQKLNSKG